MALEGTLKDFSLADILQLISLQKKTGLLSLRSPDDTVTLGFSDGRLVSAESSAKRMDTRLGTVLVKTHRLSSDSLQKALEIQAQTLQRLGFILLKNGFCSADDLREGLDIQIKKIAYSLFRWTTGDYVFDQQDRIDYDHEYVHPITVESLLMEGARMMDEWPIIERIVRSLDLVFRRVPIGQAVVPAAGDEEAEEVGDSTAEKRAKNRFEEPIKVSRAEWSVYELIDGSRSVADINERTFLSEFDGCKAFYDLVNRGLIEEVVAGQALLEPSLTVEVPTRGPAGSPAVLAVAGIVLLGWVAAAFMLAPRNPLNLVTHPPRRNAVIDSYEKSLSLLRLRRLAEAVDTYFLTSGKFPEAIDALVSANLVAKDALLDPWGRRYRYILQADKFYLVGFDPTGKTDIDLFVSHSVRTESTGKGEAIRSKSGKEIIVIQ